MPETYPALLARQDDLITRRQSLRYFTDVQVAARLGREWQVLSPGVYATFTGRLTNRHRLRVALLHAGGDAMLTDIDALRMHGIPYLPPDAFTRVLVGAKTQRVSREAVVIRRTTRLPRAVKIAGFPVAPAYRALAEFILRNPDERASLAVAAAALQLQKFSIDQLIQECERGPARGRPRLARVIEQLLEGVRSAPEADFRHLVLTSKILPVPLWNPLIQLPDGTKISPDALWVGAALVHEVNGREHHAPDRAGEDAFEDMQRRSDAMVTSDLTVLHNGPNRISTEKRSVLGEVETTFLREDGRGLPPGVVVLRVGPPGVPSDVTFPRDLAG
jgi:hypothetical protein